MKLSQFKFKLPQEQIAQYPSSYQYDEEGRIVIKEKDSFTAERDECRLMVLHARSGDIEHKLFKELYHYFDEDDLFVYNDAKVFPAVLCGNKEKTNAHIEVFLLRELNERMRLWDVLVEPARKIRMGNKLYFGPDNSLVAEVIDNTTARGRTVRFLYDGTHDEFKNDLFALGHTPLPDHIKRPAEPGDVERYQTIYAAKEGAVLAPAAGCNFSRELMKRLEIVGVHFAFVTHYSSVNMFHDIDVEDLSKYKVESEEIEVTEETCALFNKAYHEGHRICAVGTTSLRTLEYASTAPGIIKPYTGWANRFIYPPYDYNTANCLISNFQLPLTSMLMNQCAFGGYRKVMNAYAEALREGYRFGFYGDAIMIMPD